LDDTGYRLTKAVPMMFWRRILVSLLGYLFVIGAALAAPRYNAADVVIGIADQVTSGNSQTLGYDTLDRLNTAAGGYGSFGWTYDASGNRLTQKQGSVSTAYSYVAKSNLLTSLTTGGSTTQVTTSAAGNTLAVTPATGSAVIRAYDQAERLANVTIGGKQTAAYTYDAFGNRFAKTTAAGTSLFQYDPSGHLLEEATGTGTLKTDTIYLNGAPVADLTPNALFFLHTDRLGTPQVSTTTTGAIAWRAAYQPFGTNTGTSGLFTQNLRFPGQYADAETGDYQNGFRDYDPSLGRYLETDPIGLAGGVNSYAYAGNDPLNLADPLGLSALGDLGGYFGGYVGGDTGAIIGGAGGGAAGTALGGLVGGPPRSCCRRCCWNRRRGAGRRSNRLTAR
jgi:RHS repeat-associated protein